MNSPDSDKPKTTDVFCWIVECGEENERGGGAFDNETLADVPGDIRQISFVWGIFELRAFDLDYLTATGANQSEQIVILGLLVNYNKTVSSINDYNLFAIF